MSVHDRRRGMVLSQSQIAQTLNGFDNTRKVANFSPINEDFDISKDSTDDEDYGGSTTRFIALEVSDSEEANPTSLSVKDMNIVSPTAKLARLSLGKKVPILTRDNSTASQSSQPTIDSQPSTLNTQAGTLSSGSAYASPTQGVSEKAYKKRWSTLSFSQVSSEKRFSNISASSYQSSSSKRSSGSFKTLMSKVSEAIRTTNSHEETGSFASQSSRHSSHGHSHSISSHGSAARQSRIPSYVAPSYVAPVGPTPGLPHLSHSHTASMSRLQTKPSMDFDTASVASNRTTDTTMSRLRGSLLFLKSDDDNRSLRARNSFNELRKSFIGAIKKSPSTKGFFRLGTRQSMADMSSVVAAANSSGIIDANGHVIRDKSMISLPVPDAASREKIRTKLRNSSSLLSINSAMANELPQILESSEYDSMQLLTLLRLCGSDRIVQLREHFSGKLVKIARSETSEIFRSSKGGVYKIIPFATAASGEVASLSGLVTELKLTKLLSGLSGFVELQEAVVAKGKYSKNMVTDTKNSYDDNQLYLVLKLNDAGMDLHHLVIQSYAEASKIFWGVCNALKSAEMVQFEHRDLHWENILVSEKLEVTLIDYTLSRAVDRDGEVMFTRLDHPDFFKGKGDLRFEIYRIMRQRMGQDWMFYAPWTNVLWLFYVLDKILGKEIPVGDVSDQVYHDQLQKIHSALNPKHAKNGKHKPKFKGGHSDAICCQDFDRVSDVINMGKFYGYI